jgi:dTDP-4-amino-4,6-dideoxygalactose transaminase
MKVPFNNLAAQNKPLEAGFLVKVKALFDKGDYILGEEVGDFERAFAAFLGVKHAIGVSSGTDAIRLALESLKTDSKTLIITQANTFIATAIASVQSSCGSSLVLIDVDDYYQMDMEELESALEGASVELSDHKVIVIPVSMYGHPFDKKRLKQLKDKYGFKVVEDSSQAHGSKFSDGTCVGSFGDVSAFSLYPSKNLGGLGDGGVITTNSGEVKDKLLALRNYGSTIKYEHPTLGHNNRLDTIQACFLNDKIKLLKEYNSKRSEIANLYLNEIQHKDIINMRNAPYCGENTYHVYPIRTTARKELMEYLLKNGIETSIHYPVPIEKTGAFSWRWQNVYNKNTRNFAEKIVSLPIHPFLSQKKAQYVVDTINSF